MKRMAVISAGFVPVPAVDGGAGEVLTTKIVEGNEEAGDYYMDIYTIESPKLNEIHYHHANIIQIHISKWNRLMCKIRNAVLKLLHRKYRFIPYNRALLKQFQDNYDMILIENNMQVYEDIYKHSKNGTEHMIYHMHNDIDGTTKPEYLCKLIAETAEKILPVSKYIQRHFYEVAPNDKMQVLYNCVDFKVFDGNKVYPTNIIRDQYNIKESEFVFLYSGRICREKGVIELVKAFKELCKKHKTIKLIIVGSTWYHLIEKDEYYSQLIKETEQCKENIVFTGYIEYDEMPGVYASTDALVIPTMCEEAFGMVALEAMAMKIPIISTNAGGVIEVAGDDVALVVDKEKNLVAELTKAMEKLLTDKVLRERLREKAYQKAVTTKDFHQENYYDNFQKIIKI